MKPFSPYQEKGFSVFIDFAFLYKKRETNSLKSVSSNKL
jgi:hypothetical protein